MIQYSDPMGEGFLANLASLQRRLTRVSTQVSSGLRVSKPSDAPGDVVECEVQGLGVLSNPIG